MIQRLDFEALRLTAEHSEDRPYVIAGKRMYAIGMMSGAPPRLGDEHLVGEMGGLWAHPIKALEHWGAQIAGAQACALEFHSAFWCITRVRVYDNGLVLREQEWIDEDRPVMLVRVTVTNEGEAACSAQVIYEVAPRLRPCWMSPQADGRDVATWSATGLVAFDAAHPEWAVAVVVEGGMVRTVTLNPGESVQFRAAIAVTDHGGEHAARTQARAALQSMDARMEHKRSVYRAALRPDLPPRDDLDAAYRCALLNIKLLEADYPAGHYPLAGLPEYPNLFGCDVAYSVPGLCLAGRSDLAIDALRALRAVMLRQCGRTPHEVLPDGNVFHSGNTQESAQFVIAAWRACTLVGDRGRLAREFYPACRAAMLNYMRSAALRRDSPFPNYPAGDAMVEREGMLPLKLDSVCYTWRALQDLAAMARSLNGVERDALFDYAADAEEAQAWADRIAASFEHDWWIESEGLYADSLGWDGTRRLDRHWTQIVPLEVGIARPDRAERVLDALERGWLNEYGLPHTQGVDSRVWTLGNGILACVAARHGRRALARRLLGGIALTLTAGGQLGLYEELTPHGLCFIQLWSAALFVEAYTALHSSL